MEHEWQVINNTEVSVCTISGLRYLIGTQVANLLDRETFNMYRSMKGRNILLHRAEPEQVDFMVRNGAVKAGTHSVTLVPFTDGVAFIFDALARGPKSRTPTDQRKRTKRARKETPSSDEDVVTLPPLSALTQAPQVQVHVQPQAQVQAQPQLQPMSSINTTKQDKTDGNTRPKKRQRGNEEGAESSPLLHSSDTGEDFETIESGISQHATFIPVDMAPIRNFPPLEAVPELLLSNKPFLYTLQPRLHTTEAITSAAEEATEAEFGSYKNMRLSILEKQDQYDEEEEEEEEEPNHKQIDEEEEDKKAHTQRQRPQPSVSYAPRVMRSRRKPLPWNVHRSLKKSECIPSSSPAPNNITSASSTTKNTAALASRKKQNPFASLLPRPSQYCAQDAVVPVAPMAT